MKTDINELTTNKKVIAVIVEFAKNSTIEQIEREIFDWYSDERNVYQIIFPNDAKRNIYPNNINSRSFIFSLLCDVHFNRIELV